MRLKLLMLIFFLTYLCSCDNSDKVISKSDFIFNTYVTVTLYSYENEEVLEDCFELFRSYERKFSKTITDSDIYKLNNAQGESVYVSDETVTLLNSGLYFSELSEGVFDITIAPLSFLWDFSDRSVKPNDSDIKEALNKVNYKNVTILNNTVKLLNGAQLDLGGIAKGFIADELALYLKEEGVSSAIINIGGNVLTIGTRNSENWNIAIRKPFSDSNIDVLNIPADMSVVTSGIYERFFVDDDTIYHHILDTNTGYPINNSLASVTIIGEPSIACDAYSTICFSLGLEEGLSFIDSLDNFEAVFITRDNKIFYSKKFNTLEYKISNYSLLTTSISSII